MAEKEIKSPRKERLLVLEKTCIYKGPASIKKKKKVLSFFWAVQTMLASSNAMFLWMWFLAQEYQYHPGIVWDANFLALSPDILI